MTKIKFCHEHFLCRAIFFILIASLFVGCAKGIHKEPKSINSSLSNILKKIKKDDDIKQQLTDLEYHIAQVKKEFTISLYPPIEINKKVDIHVKDAPVKDAFRLLAEQANFSVVFDFQNVTTEDLKITASFKRIPANEVIKRLVKSYHLWYTFEDNVLTLKDTVTTSVMLPVFLFDDKANFDSDMVKIKVQGDFSKTLEQNLQDIVGDSGKIVLNTRTGMVFLKGQPDKVIKALTYLEDLRNHLLKYIFVKMYIVKINTKKAREIGFDFDKMLRAEGKDIEIKGSSLGELTNPSLTFSLSSDKLNLLLKMIEQKEIGDIISSPFFMVRNNSMAGIKITNQVGWIDPGDVDVVTGGNTSSVTQGKPEFKTLDVGISIVIYPRLLTSSVVQILASIKDTSLERFLTFPWQPSKDVQPITLEYPLISKREFTTQIIAQKDVYVVLGGFKSSKNDSKNVSVPFVHKIPLIGDSLFTYKNKDIETKDLYIIMNFLPL